jgi:hypothetical protein
VVQQAAPPPPEEELEGVHPAAISAAARAAQAATAPRARTPEPELAFAGARPRPSRLSFNDPSATPSAFAKAAQPKEAEGGGDEVQTFKREGKKVGRNDPCPCGSGKKYKKCHGGN